MIKGHAPLLTRFKELQFHTELIFGIFSTLRETKKIVVGILFFFCIFLVINFLYNSRFLKNNKYSVSERKVNKFYIIFWTVIFTEGED